MNWKEWYSTLPVVLINTCWTENPWNSSTCGFWWTVGIGRLVSQFGLLWHQWHYYLYGRDKRNSGSLTGVDKGVTSAALLGSTLTFTSPTYRSNNQIARGGNKCTPSLTSLKLMDYADYMNFLRVFFGLTNLKNKGVIWRLLVIRWYFVTCLYFVICLYFLICLMIILRYYFCIFGRSGSG